MARCSGRTVSLALAFAFALALVTVAGSAAAGEGDVAAARAAYDRGAAAYDAGEYAVAAAQLARADALVPNDVALELALKAAVKAADPVLAIELAERADERTAPPGLAAAREDARAKVKGRVGRMTVTCPTEATCSATLDDAPFPVGQTRWVLVGQHRVVVAAEGATRQAFQVRIDPGASVPVTAAAFVRAPLPQRGAASAADRPEPSAGRGGISPIWFWVGAGVSAVLGGGTIASAVDTKNKHDEFTSRPSAELGGAGVDAQLRTNLLLAGTAAAVVATAVAGLVLVRWSDTPTPTREVDGQARGARR